MLALVVRQLHAVDDDAALLVLLQVVDAADHGGLARSRRTANDNLLTLFDGKVDVVQHLHDAEPFVDAAEFDGIRAAAHRMNLLFSHVQSPRACSPHDAKAWLFCANRAGRKVANRGLTSPVTISRARSSPAIRPSVAPLWLKAT